MLWMVVSVEFKDNLKSLMVFHSTAMFGAVFHRIQLYAMLYVTDLHSHMITWRILLNFLAGVGISAVYGTEDPATEVSVRLICICEAAQDGSLL